MMRTILLGLIPACGLIATLTLIAADPVELPLPEGVEIPADPSSGENSPNAQAVYEQQLFQDALQGKEVVPSDPMMADVLQIMRSRGSMLDGTAFDSPPHLDGESTGWAATRQASRIALVAESLLVAARQLESVDPQGQHADLIRQMRAEAGRLLTK